MNGNRRISTTRIPAINDVSAAAASPAGVELTWQIVVGALGIMVFFFFFPENKVFISLISYITYTVFYDPHCFQPSGSVIS